MLRHSRTERRNQYLEAGLQIVSEMLVQPECQAALALSHVKVSDVAERAGVSKGAIYHVWPNQEAYWVDLLRAMLESTSTFGKHYFEWVSAVSSGDQAGSGAGLSGAGPTNVRPPGSRPTFGDFTRALFESRVDNPAFFVRTALRSYATDPSIRAHLDAEAERAADMYSSALGAIIRSSGRRLRAEATMRSVITNFNALLTGLVIRHRYCPTSVKDLDLPGRGRVPFFALAAEAVLVHCTEPIDGDPDRYEDIELGHLLGTPLDHMAIAELAEHAESFAHPSAADRAADRETDRARDDRTDFYLGIGLDLLEEFSHQKAAEAPVEALANVRISSVAERMGMTKGSVYHIWPSQEAFRLDLLAQLLKEGNVLALGALSHAVESSLPSPESTDQFLNTVCDLAFDALKDDARFLARFSFVIYAPNPPVGKLLRDANHDVIGEFKAAIDLYLLTCGRTLRPALDDDSVISCAEAALFGLCLLYRTSPMFIDAHRSGDSDPETESGHSRFAQAMAAVVHHFTEPFPG